MLLFLNLLNLLSQLFTSCVHVLMCWFSLQQWASLYQPLIFSNEVSQTDSAADVFLNKLDPTKAFRGKAKVPPPKKKQSAQSNSGGAAKGQGSAGRHGGAKR